ncbi:ATP-grasp domain-containing protein [Streptomyces sp. NPDC007861]|uniref:preATP grasp domain-containing protein n=1 Tax=Streptomyces sp. NPDC007861 TaxID=3154893 RepID=UPI00341049CF
MDQNRSPLIVYANFFSDVAVSFTAHDVLTEWAGQAPRKIWLLQPGDALVTPVAPSGAFRRYACELLGVPSESLKVMTSPPTTGLSMAEALHQAGLMGSLRGLVTARPGAELLPVVLDASTADLARRLGVAVAAYGPGGPSGSAVDAVYRFNTKSGFRALAAELGIRMPEGRVCEGPAVEATAAAMLRQYERVVVKPDRSAGGHGLYFLSRAETVPALLRNRLTGTWVVEERLDVVRPVSIQMHLDASGLRVVFSGEMRVQHGSYTGYVSPLSESGGTVTAELEQWGVALGHHLARSGYAGPYGVDAILAADGRLYATESNVRRTATTTAQFMASRLARAAGLDAPAWLLGRRRTRAPHGFKDAVRLLGRAGLSWASDPAGRAGGVVLYGDAPADGRSWRYAVLGSTRTAVVETEEALVAVMEFEDPLPQW